ncbi:putative Nrap protein, domain 3 [Helianthus annuus]|nr:putative Nrap protein, domain 3 [Helianthus annuus]
MAKVDFPAKFDYCMRLNLKGKTEVSAQGFCLDNECWRLYEDKVHSLLKEGLGDRIKSVRVTWQNATSTRCINDMADVAKDLTAGTIGGATHLIVGHPFDTIKVKLQSQPVPPPGQLPRYSGAIDAVKQTIAAEGPRGLYKGMGAPLATVAALNAVLFTVRGQMEALLRSEPGAPLIVHIIIHLKKI